MGCKNLTSGLVHCCSLHVPLRRANCASLVMASHSSKITSLNLLLQQGRQQDAASHRSFNMWPHTALQTKPCSTPAWQVGLCVCSGDGQLGRSVKVTAAVHRSAKRRTLLTTSHNSRFNQPRLLLQGQLASLATCSSSCSPEDAACAGKVLDLLPYDINASVI